ncbi:MAG: TonB-dependent receptor plug domain-containing protein, partial [Chitinophaga sp.]
MCSIQSFALSGYAQEKVTLSMKQTSLRKVLKAIEKQIPVHFVYNNEMLQDLAPVDIEVKDKTWTETLRQVLKDTKLDYKTIAGNLVVIAPAGDKPHAVQAIVAHGKVTDSQQLPLIGVSVWERGTTNGTITKEDGSFSLTVKSDTATLMFKFVGYVTQERRVTSAAMNIVLEEGNTALNEVVVVGYGTQKAANLTGAVSTVNAKTLESRPLVNLAQGLQGSMPGLRVNLNNGAPGQGASFNIRGDNPVGSGAAPLVLVDGVVMDPNLINPDDVESVTMLKDAASAAIYGGRAAYGVLLITTKSGKTGKINISYSGNYTLSRPTRLPDYLSGPEYINMFRD